MIMTIFNIIKPLLALFRQPSFENKIPNYERTADKIKILRDYLTVNRFSRPGIKRKSIQKIEIHWVANPKTSAKANRNYFENRKGGKTGFGSTHFIIDLDGDIIQMIPEAEIAYSSGGKKYKNLAKELGTPPYNHTLSIECTHVDWTGAMADKTVVSLKRLCKYLIKKHNLTSDDIILHYDLTGKECHRYYVDNPDEFKRFKDSVLQ